MKVANRKFVLKTNAGIVALAIATSGMAHAQEIADEAEGTFDGTPIVVTGTRIQAPGANSSIPITSLDADFIERSGETNLTDLLAEHPALVGSTTSLRTAGVRVAEGGAGANFLNLRNLGTGRTLVLINGRRHVSSIAGSVAVDINTIPVALVERVDVLTGGVSAVYGADGVSGVVNFVTKRDFEGIEARVQGGISSRGDAEENYASITAGQNFAQGAGNVALSYEYRRSARVRADERRYGRAGGISFLEQNQADLADDPTVPDLVPYDDLRVGVLAPAGAVFTNFGPFPDFLGTGAPYDIGMPIFGSQGLSQGGDGTPLAGSAGDLQPGIETHNANLLLSYEASAAVRVFAEGKYVSATGYTEGQPVFDGGSFLYADNPYLPQSVRDAIIPGILPLLIGAPPGVLSNDSGVGVIRPHYDFGNQSQRDKRETWRLVLGMDGEISENARYEVAYTFGQTKTRVTTGGQRFADRYFAALDAVAAPDGSIVCRSDLNPFSTFMDANYGGPALTFTPGQGECAPLNILGTNVASDEALAFFLTDLINRMKVKQHVLTASISGDFGERLELPGGPISFAFGAEYREESSSFTPDELLLNGLILDQAPALAESGRFDVWEVFGEVLAPVLRDVPGAELLQVGAALRLSDYSTVGSTTAWKVHGTYEPISDVRFRASYSEAVRAPNIGELFAAPSGTRTIIDDPCYAGNIANGTEFRADNCANLFAQFGVTDPALFNPGNDPMAGFALPGIVSGNEDLKEETAKTWTAGISVTPTIAPGLALSFDWYDIKLKNAINTATAQELADLCVDQPSLDNVFCQNVVRDPGNGFIIGFSQAPANVSRFQTAGADFTINYAFSPDVGVGDFNIRLVGGYLDKLTFIASPGAGEVDSAKEAFAPKWSGNFDLTWTKGNVTANYGITYFSKTRRFTAAEVAANPDIAEAKYLFYREKWQHDVQLAVKTNDERFTIYGGVNNLFDRKPDIGETQYPISFRGRFLYLGVKANLD